MDGNDKSRRKYPFNNPNYCFLVALLLVTQPASATLDIMVNPRAGSKGLAEALSKAREARVANRARPQPIRIVLKAGDYVLSEPWTITSADSGTPQAPLLIEPETPGSATLMGGAPLPLTERVANRWFFSPPVPIDQQAEISGGQLFVNGRRTVLAREPDEDSWWFVRASNKDHKQQLPAFPADIARLRGLLGGQEPRAILTLMHSWTSEQHRIVDLLPAGDGATLLPPTRLPTLNQGKSQRWYVENLPGALNKPGEWIAMEGKLAYVPRSEDARQLADKKSATAVWPRLATLLRVQGDNAPDHRVANIAIKGLKFAYSYVPIPDEGWIDRFGDSNTPALIEIENASSLRLTECDIRHAGGYAVWFKGGVVNSEISRCVMDDLGAGGIKVGLEMDEQANALPTAANVIKQNVITRIGQEFPGGIGVFVNNSGRNLVTSNLIAHTSYSGIVVKCCGNPMQRLPGAGSEVKNNVLIDIGQGKLSDLAGIYTYGRVSGTAISGNFIRQVRSYPYGPGSWGIYNDEGSANVTVDGNVVIGTTSGGYILHWGQDNVVRNNLFADSGEAAVRWGNPNLSGNWLFQGNAISIKPGIPDLMLRIGDPKQMQLRMGLKNPEADINHVSVKTGAEVADVTVSGGVGRQQAIWSSVIKNTREVLNAAEALPGVSPELLSLPALAIPQAGPKNTGH
jgi:hypothetical protein